MKKILIVEDEQAYSDLLSDTLGKKGYSVMVATNGEQGLEMAMSQMPDLILLDIRMPVMDGVAMLTELRKLENGKITKVIMLTNLEPDELIIDNVISNLPLYYFVKSDIGLNDLIEKITQVLAD